MTTDRDILLLFKRNTDEDFWTNREGWEAHINDLNSWFGVSATADGRVVCLEFPTACIPFMAKRLVGGIPPELGQLDKLKKINLSNNQLTGGIPVELGQLSNMEELILFGNQLTGGIPFELVQLILLKYLDLSYNQLTGDIPTELGQLENMKWLNLSKNQFTGGVPVELGKLSKVEGLILNGNQLTGSIPVQLGQLNNMLELDLSNNLLKGTIPVDLGQLGNLKKLDLLTNQLTDVIPVELGQLDNLEELDLSGNKLTGSIPIELGKLGKLKNFNLSRNQLKGCIPVQLGQLRNMERVDLSNNQLTGGIPFELGQLENIISIDLSSNRLTGGIPAKLGQLCNMKGLYLSNNQLTGDIPVELGQLDNLEGIFFSDNQLKGFGRVEDALKVTIRLSSIKRVGLRDNPWRMPPEAVVEQGLDAVRSYLIDVKDAKDTGASTTSLQLLKVVLMGSSRAGKTSLINSIVKGCAAPTEGGPEEASTVGIELHNHDIGNTTVEFYDCAGQLDYAGMHQTFLSKRALYLLVWDVTSCQDLSTESVLDKVIREKILMWLAILHLRAPKATVMLVANKCDGAIGGYAEVADRVEQRARMLLKEWQNKRGLGDRDGRSSTNLSWLSGRNLISCKNFAGISELVRSISAFGSTSIDVPPSWDLALTVVNALRKNDTPLTAVQDHLKLTEMPPNTGREEKWAHTFVTRRELLREWLGTVDWVRLKRGERKGTDAPSSQDVRGGRVDELCSPERAFEGALWISEFAGRILSFDGGKGLFLDVVWLSKVLSPILSHKLILDDTSTTAALWKARDHLIHNGILQVDFARYLWRKVLNGSTFEQSDDDRMVKSLYRVLLELGVILPLGHTTLSDTERRLSSGPFDDDGTPPDVLVIMRLPDTDDHIEKERLQASVTEALEGAKEVVLKWRFDSAGAPYGFIERLIASCHRVGEVEMELCWRFGAVFKSHATVEQNEQPVRLYRFIIRCDDRDGPRQSDGVERVLTLRMIGPLDDEKVWIALRYVASAMIILSEEWQGVLWRGWSECSRHPTDVMYLATPYEAKISGRLIPEADPGATRIGCDCTLGRNTVQGLLLRRLGEVIDTTQGDPFATALSTGGSSASNTSPGTGKTTDVVRVSESSSSPKTPSHPISTSEEDLSQDSEPSCCRLAFDMWRESAWYFAGSLGSLSLGIFFGGALVGIMEGMETLWMVSIILVGMLALGAIVSAAVACRDGIEERRQRLTSRVTSQPSEAIV